MSYVQANTSNPLGRRTLGWDNPPYPVYKLSRSVARLNGLRGEDHNGAVTYRIDPRTGGYRFYRTDIKPRGVFMQNTFQHPAPPVVSALGVSVLPIGKSATGSTLQRGPVSQSPLIAMRPGVTLSGLGCGSCGGGCSSRLSGPRFSRRRGLRGLGADECSFDSDCGPGGACAAGMCVTQQIPVAAPDLSVGPFPTVPVPPDPSVLSTAGAIAQGIQQVVQTATGPRVVVVQKPASSNPFAYIPNTVLLTGGVLFAALLAGGRRR